MLLGESGLKSQAAKAFVSIGESVVVEVDLKLDVV